MPILQGHPENVQSSIKTNLWPTLKMSWRVWPIAQLINFAFVPLHFRVLFGNVVRFFWTIYLSYQAAVRQAYQAAGRSTGRLNAGSNASVDSNPSNDQQIPDLKSGIRRPKKQKLTSFFV